MSDEVLVKVEGVSKKFCRSLKRSLWYGVQDVSAELFGRKGSHDELRKNEFWAVNDVSFELRRGECLGLIGPNGAGKSTLLKMLNGLVKPDQGRITMRGRVGALIELGAGFNPILTVRENIYVYGSVLGLTKRDIDRKFEEIVDFAEIHSFVDTPFQNLSSGMKVRVGFAVSAQLAPDVLIIDEVLAVGDAAFRRKCYRTTENLAKAGTALLFVSHDIEAVKRHCDGALYLSKGAIIARGKAKLICDLYEESTSEGLTDLQIAEQHGRYSRPTTSKGTFDGREYGRGKVAIHSVELRNDANQVVSSLKENMPFKICIQVDLFTRIEDMVLGMMLKTVDGIPVYGMNTLNDAPTGTIQESQSIEVCFELEGHLLPGTYYLNVSASQIIDGQLSHLHRLVDCALLKVVGAGSTHRVGYANLNAAVTLSANGERILAVGNPQGREW